jgi:hypothetical protein
MMAVANRLADLVIVKVAIEQATLVLRLCNTKICLVIDTDIALVTGQVVVEHAEGNKTGRDAQTLDSRTRAPQFQ